MIISLPRHISQTAELSARARIPLISQWFLDVAHKLAKLDDGLAKTNNAGHLNDYLRKDIGQASVVKAQIHHVVHGIYLG